MGIIQNIAPDVPWVVALAIGIVVGAMSKMEDLGKQAKLFSLPFAFGTAVLFLDEKIGAANVIGLLLFDLFLWVVHLLYRNGVPIWLADFAGVVVYVIGGYYARLLNLSFGQAVLLYFGAWVAYIFWHYRQPVPPKVETQSIIPASVKGTAAAGIAWLLMIAKERVGELAGAVVTFPFMAVSVVCDKRHNLDTFVMGFCHNSVNVLGFFVAIYLVQEFTLVDTLPWPLNSITKVLAGGLASWVVLRVLNPKERTPEPSRPQPQPRPILLRQGF